MQKYKVEVDATVKGQKDINKLNDSLEETQDEQEGVNEGFNEMGGTADKMTGGMVSGMMAVKSSVMASVKSLGIMRVAIMATGLGALLLVITSIKAAFTSSEEGQNKFNKLMNALGVITGNITDLLSDFGMVIINAFENPVESIKALWQAIKDNIMVRINSTIEMFGLLGKAIKQVFTGDFDGAMKSGKEAALKFVDSMTGVEDSVSKATTAVSGLVDEMEREIAVSNRLSDIQADLAKKERIQLIERAKLQGKIAEIRVKAMDIEGESAEDRLIYLQQGMDMNDQLFKQEEELARMRLEIKREQNKLSNSTKEDLMEEAQLEAALINLKRERAGALRFMYGQFLVAKKEYLAELETLGAVEIDIDQDIADSIGEIETEGAESTIATEDWKADKKEEIEKMSAQGTLNAVGGLFGMLADLSDKDFERQKKFRIAEAVVSTISGAVSAFMGGVATIPGPFGLALGAVLAGATLAAGYANIQKIKASTPNSSGGGGSASAGGSSSSIPRMTAPGQEQITPMTTGEANISSAMGGDDKPLQAFTVSSEMTSQQQLDRRIEMKAAI